MSMAIPCPVPIQRVASPYCPPAAIQLVQQGCHHARAGGAEGMPERDGPSIRIDFGDRVRVGRCRASACAAKASFSSMTSRSSIVKPVRSRSFRVAAIGPRSHDRWIETDNRRSENARFRPESQLRCALFFHHQHSGSAVVDAAGIASRDTPAVAEHRFQPGEISGRCPWPRMFVGRDPRSLPCLAGRRHGNDFTLEPPFRNRDSGTTLAFGCERILRLAAHLASFSNILGGLSHGIGIVPRRQLWIDESPTQTGIDQRLIPARKWLVRFEHDVGGAGHAFHPARQENRTLAGRNRLGCGRDCLQPGGTQAIDGLTRNRFRQIQRSGLPCEPRCDCPRRPDWCSRE